MIRNSAENNNIGYVEGVLDPMGTVLHMSPTGISIMGNSGKKYLARKGNALEPLKEDDKVYFTPKIVGKNYYANYIHKAGTASYCYRLAKSKIDKDLINEGKEILKHILECFPDHQPAKNLLASPVSHNNGSNRERQYNDACSKWDSGDTDTAAKMFSELLNDKSVTQNDSVNEGCIKYLAKYYVNKFTKSNDEDDKIIATEFIEENYSKINETEAVDSKIELYYKLGKNQDCLDLIDFKLDDETLSSAERSRLFYYKALNLQNLGRYNDSEEFALKSLSITPFANLAEKKLSISDRFTPALSRPIFDQNRLYTLSLNHISKNIQEGEEITALQKAETWIIESAQDYSFLSIAAVIDDKNSKKYFLEYLFKKASDVYDEDPESSLFIWSQIFLMVPGYGYFNHKALFNALSTILGVESSDDKNPIDVVFEKKINNNPEITDNEWRSILISISTNQDVINVVLRSINSSDQLMAQFKQFISNVDQTLIDGELAGTHIVEKIIPILEFNNRAAVQRLNNTIPDSPSIDEIINGLTSLDYVGTPFNKLQSTDKTALYSLFESVVPLVIDLQNETDTQEKIIIIDGIHNTCDKINQKIINRPTYFSVFGVSHILELIIQSLQKWKGIIDETSLPKLSISIITDRVSPRKGIYSIGVQVKNDEGLATAEKVKLELKSQKLSSQGTVSPNETNISVGNINGGSIKQGSFNIKLPKSITSKPSFGFAINYKAYCKGRLLNGTVTPLQVRFDDGVFEEISYQPYRPGKGLPYNDSTFFGRSKEVNEIVNKIIGNNDIDTQLIVYGQARCGKTSLLNRVNGVLNNEYKASAWCVMGQL